MMLAQVLMDKFVHRTDAYAVMGRHPWQGRDNYYDRVLEPVTLDLIESHLNGGITLAVFPTDIPTQTCRFVCWDVDDPDPVHLQKALILAKRVGTPIIEASGAEGRYHVWVLFDEPRDIKEVRAEAFGSTHRPGIDCFPHRDRVIDDHYFELPIKLPLGFHRAAGRWSEFVDEDLKPVLPEQALGAV